MIATDQVVTVQRDRTASDAAIPLLCWDCGSFLISDIHITNVGPTEQRCEACQSTTALAGGVWRALSPEREVSFRRFAEEYEFIREAEGHGSQDAEYYLALPFQNCAGQNVHQWKIRARTYAHLVKHVVQPLAAKGHKPLRILDLGAGNGWLSYRLSLLGQSLVAADLLTNCQDGLGAASHYAEYIHPLFPRVQTDMDQLPFPDATFDLVIFNASFHYSSDYGRTLQEALRCIAPQGAVVIADTAWYAREESGEAMVSEKQSAFRAKYGFPSNALASLEYLTPMRIQHLADAHKLHWQSMKPFHGVRWALRPVLAKLKHRRIPSQFFLHVVRVKQ